jgi:hypothetical protein
VNVTYTPKGSSSTTTVSVLLYYDEIRGNYTAATSVSIPIMDDSIVDKEYDSTNRRVKARIGTDVIVTYDFSKQITTLN